MKKKIIIIGSGSHSKVLASEIIKLKQHELIGFIDEYKNKNNIIYKTDEKNYKVIGKIKDLKNYTSKNIFGIVGVGLNYQREKIVKQIKMINKDFQWISIISKDSLISTNTVIEEGSVIMSGCIINTGTKIGKHCIINTGSIIEHDNIFSNYTSTSPRVTTGGNVTVGKLSCIGISSAVSHNIKIGKNTFIGGKSFVSKDCDDNFLYHGVPAKKIRLRDKNEKL